MEMRNCFVCLLWFSTGGTREESHLSLRCNLSCKMLPTINLKNPDQCSLSYYLVTENLVKVLEQQNCHQLS